MGQAPSKSVEDKVRIVLAVLRGEISTAAAARRSATAGPVRGTWITAVPKVNNAPVCPPLSTVIQCSR